MYKKGGNEEQCAEEKADARVREGWDGIIRGKEMKQEYRDSGRLM